MPARRRVTPPPDESPTETSRWSLSHSQGRVVLAAKDDGGHPFLTRLTTREAVRLASHLLASVDGLMKEEELRRPLASQTPY